MPSGRRVPVQLLCCGVPHLDPRDEVGDDEASAANAARDPEERQVGHRRDRTGPRRSRVGVGDVPILAREVSMDRARGRFALHAQVPSRRERPRLPRQRGAHADRQVRRRARRHAGRRARRASRSGRPSSGPGSPDATPIDEVLMGQVLQAGVGQAPARQAALGRPPRHDERHDDQPGLRLGPEVDHARRRGDPGGRRRGRGRRRHGDR